MFKIEIMKSIELYRVKPTINDQEIVDINVYTDIKDSSLRVLRIVSADHSVTIIKLDHFDSSGIVKMLNEQNENPSSIVWKIQKQVTGMEYNFVGFDGTDTFEAKGV